MAEKPSLGTRYTCFACEAKFYDLGRPDPICPRCGADQRERPAPPPPSSRPVKKKSRRATTDEFAAVERDDLEDFDENFSQAMSEEFSAEFDDDVEEEPEEEEAD